MSQKVSFKKVHLTDDQAKILFDHLKRLNPEQATKIGGHLEYKDLIHGQRGSANIVSMIRHNTKIIKGGTDFSNQLSLTKDLKSKLTLTGFELSQVTFSDALSIIRILLMNKAILDGDLEPGLLVDFQGASHLHNKSYFFDNPQYAIEVALTNVHEILPHIQGVENTDDVLERLRNMDEATWLEVFVYIGLIPFTEVDEATTLRSSTKVNDKQRQSKQRKMHKAKPYFATRSLDKTTKSKLKEIIDKLANL